jgi:hypothetical protein
MAGSTPVTAKDAHYHPIKVTELWAAFRAANEALAVRDADYLARKEREREHETTYARDELGGH